MINFVRFSDLKVETVSQAERTIVVTEVGERTEGVEVPEQEIWDVSNTQTPPGGCGEGRRRRSGYMICTTKRNRNLRKM